MPFARTHWRLVLLLLCAAWLVACTGGAGAPSPTPSPIASLSRTLAGTPTATATPTATRTPTATLVKANPGPALQLGPVASLSGNQIQAVALDGDLAYAASGPELTLLSLANPARPARVARLFVPGGFAGIVLAGGHAYLAGGDEGLHIVDASNPAHPRLAATLPIAASHVVIAGGRAYVSGPRLTILSLSQPDAPVELGRFELSGPQGPLGTVAAVQGLLAYACYTTYDGRGGLRILDVANPALPRQAGAMAVDQPVVDLAVVGRYVYLLAGGEKGRLYVVDVADPARPVVRGTTELPWPASALAAVGPRLYVAGNGGFLLLDALDPLRPRAIGRWEEAVPQVLGLAVAGQQACLATGAGLVTIDLSDPSQPRRVGDYRQSPQLDAYLDVHGLTLAGTHAYLAAGETGLVVLDVSDPSEPAVAVVQRTEGHAWEVAVAGRLACVAAEYAGLRVLDVSDPRRPVELGAYDPPGLLEFFHAVALAGDYAYVADGSYQGSGLRVVDLSDPSHPRETAFLPLPAQGTGPDAPRAEAVAVADGRLYLAAGTAGLRVYDLAKPASPRELGALDTPGRADNLALAGRYAFLVDGDLRIVDLSDPAHLREAGFYDLPDWAATPHVAVRGRYAFVTGEGLRVLDVADPARVAEVCTYPWNSSEAQVAVAGETVYAAGGGLMVLRLQ